MSYVKDPPTTLPEAMARIKELEKKIESLETAIDLHLVPAWVIEDVPRLGPGTVVKLRKTEG